MAWPSDKAGYRPSKRSKAQEEADKVVGNAASAVKSGLDAVPAVTRTAMDIAKNIGPVPAIRAVSSVGSAAASGLSEGSNKQNAYMATQANKKERTALGAKYPNGRVVDGNIPMVLNTQPVPQRDGIGSRRIDPATQTSFRRAMAQPAVNAAGQAPEVARQALVKQYSGLGSRQPASGIQRVGNMDVTFAPGTSTGARRAFMEAGAGRNPEGVTIDPDITARADRLHQEQYERRISGGGMVPLYQSVRSPLPGAQPVSTEAVDFAKMTPAQRRFAVANEKIAAVRGNQSIERDRNNISAMGNEQTYQLGQGRNALEARGQDLTADVAAERNRIDAAGVAVQDRATQSEVEARDLDIQDKLSMQRLQEAYTKETDPAKKKELEMQLRTLMGKPQDKFQIVTRKDVGPDGEVIETPYMVTPDGSATPVGASEQPTLPPRDNESRVVGKKYTDAAGNIIIWDGKGFVRG